MPRIILTVILLAAFSVLARAQTTTTPFDSSSGSAVGGTMGMRTPLQQSPTFGASAGTQILRHRDMTGKPCLSVGAFARAHTTNPNLYDHVIIAVNGCPLRIAMQVCYYQSQDCIPMEIPGGERKEAILGTLPAMKDFRFEYREKF
jgi:hypothetical protein